LTTSIRPRRVSIGPPPRKNGDVPEPGPPLSDAEVARSLAAVHRRLAALASGPEAANVASELGEIRKHLRDLAGQNAQVRERLGESLGLRQAERRDEGPPDAA
jgi:hypothetical protein